MTIYKTEDKPFPDEYDSIGQYAVYNGKKWYICYHTKVEYMGDIWEDGDGEQIYDVTHWMLLEKPKD